MGGQRCAHECFQFPTRIFGTFNKYTLKPEARERFLTPLNARSIKVILKREFGG
jgi:hypothetical protein